MGMQKPRPHGSPFCISINLVFTTIIAMVLTNLIVVGAVVVLLFSSYYAMLFLFLVHYHFGYCWYRSIAVAQIPCNPIEKTRIWMFLFCVRELWEGFFWAVSRGNELVA